MKQKKCKICNIIFEPKKYAVSKTKCEQCIKEKDKAKRFEYLKKQFEKPLKNRFSEQNPKLRAKTKIDKQWIKIAKLVKERDAGKPCISCGKIMQPHKIQAGHYISRAKAIIFLNAVLGFAQKYLPVLYKAVKQQELNQ